MGWLSESLWYCCGLLRRDRWLPEFTPDPIAKACCSMEADWEELDDRWGYAACKDVVVPIWMLPPYCRCLSYLLKSSHMDVFKDKSLAGVFPYLGGGFRTLVSPELCDAWCDGDGDLDDEENTTLESFDFFVENISCRCVSQWPCGCSSALQQEIMKLY